MSALNGIGWFEIATEQPAEAERFYGEVFGWTFDNDKGAATGADGAPYRIISTPGGGLQGGLFPTGGKTPSYAIFYVLVADPDAACRAAEAAGGKVLVAPQRTPDGLAFAHLLDPAGNHFGVFTPPAGGE